MVAADPAELQNRCEGGVTVTLKEHEAVLLEASVAVQFTGVVPMLKVEPDAGTQLATTPGQLSLAVGAG